MNIGTRSFGVGGFARPECARRFKLGWLVVGVLAAAAGLLAKPEPTAAGGLLPPPGNACFFQICVDVEVLTTGAGTGTVTSDPAGINCRIVNGSPADLAGCEAQFGGSGQVTVFLTLMPDPGNTCVPVSCSISQARSASADWSPTVGFTPGGHSLTVAKSGAGTGTVVSTNVSGINCGSACSKTYSSGTQVTLTATPAAGSVFKSWTGACNGQGATCNLTITAATSTAAVFELSSTGGGGTTTPPPSGGSTGGTTGGGTTSGGTGGTSGSAGGASDAAVEAQVVATKTGKSRLGKRIVQVELNLDESVAVTLTLVRKGKTLASRRVGNAKAGNRVLTLVVPNAVAKGRASLRLELKDGAGNTLSAKRNVTVPSK